MEAELADVNEQLGEKLDALYEFDPDCALAHAGIGGVHITKGSPHIGEPVTRVFKKQKFEAVVKSWIPPASRQTIPPSTASSTRMATRKNWTRGARRGRARVREAAAAAQSERVLLLEAMALSAAEVDPRTAEALYRPFGEMESVLERTRTLTSESDVAIAGVAREGPFTRYEDEVSPERKLAGSARRARSGACRRCASAMSGACASWRRAPRPATAARPTPMPPRRRPTPPRPRPTPPRPRPTPSTSSPEFRTAPAMARRRPAPQSACGGKDGGGLREGAAAHRLEVARAGVARLDQRPVPARPQVQPVRMVDDGGRRGEAGGGATRGQAVQTERVGDPAGAPVLREPPRAAAARVVPMRRRSIPGAVQGDAPPRAAGVLAGGHAVPKVTVAINNATPVHFDQKNLGSRARARSPNLRSPARSEAPAASPPRFPPSRFLACFDLDENRVVGGSHRLFCLDNKRAIVVTDTKDGVYMVGDTDGCARPRQPGRRALCPLPVTERGVAGPPLNLASRSGRRLIVTCYTSKTLVDLVEK